MVDSETPSTAPASAWLMPSAVHQQRRFLHALAEQRELRQNLSEIDTVLGARDIGCRFVLGNSSCSCRCCVRCQSCRAADDQPVQPTGECRLEAILREDWRQASGMPACAMSSALASCPHHFHANR
jgi:hypothetical protein